MILLPPLVSQTQTPSGPAPGPSVPAPATLPPVSFVSADARYQVNVTTDSAGGVVQVELLWLNTDGTPVEAPELIPIVASWDP